MPLDWLRSLPKAYFDGMCSNYDAGTRRTALKLYRNTSDLGALDVATQSLAAKRLPALMAWGARDPYISVGYAEMQCQFFAVESAVRLEDSGHWPMIDNPAAVAKAVIPFLRKQTVGTD